MTPEELKIKIASKSNIQIIDLREEYEYEDGSICKTNIPMGEVMTRLNEINNEGEVVMFCKSGKRSKSMVFMLQKKRGLAHIQQLEGGYEAWCEKK